MATFSALSKDFTLTMVDYTHSFTRNASMIPPFDKWPFPPASSPITTIVCLKSREKVCGPSRTWNDRLADTPAASAFEDFLRAISEEPGYDKLGWGGNPEEENAVTIFVTWQTNPPKSFQSSYDFRHIPSISSLASFHEYHSSPPIIYNVVLQGPSFPTSPGWPLHYELIIWHIPAQLDPTYYQEHAEEFDRLRKWFRRAEGDDDFDTTLFGDLRRDFRGWAITGDNDVVENATTHPTEPVYSNNEPSTSNDNQQPVSTKSSASHDPPSGKSPPMETADRPFERTHVFVLWWKDQEAAMRFKDPKQVSIKGGKIEVSPLMWKTGFEELQERWVGQGMRVENYHSIVRGWYNVPR